MKADKEALESQTILRYFEAGGARRSLQSRSDETKLVPWEDLSSKTQCSPAGETLCQRRESHCRMRNQCRTGNKSPFVHLSKDDRSRSLKNNLIKETTCKTQTRSPCRRTQEETFCRENRKSILLGETVSAKWHDV